MKRTVLFTALCVTLAPGMVWASPIQGTTNPNAFTQDYINWCQFSCSSTTSPPAWIPPQPWLSNAGATGTITLPTGGAFYSYEQGTTPFTWRGNFPSGMGLIYNGYQYSFQQTGIRITFNSPVEGVGAYIQGNGYNPPSFSAAITLFGQNGNSLGSFTTDGVSDNTEGTALFIGAYGVGPIFSAQFDVIDSAGFDDFALGTLKFGSPIPEPSSLLLFASSALGVAGVIRRRFNRGMLR